MHRSLAQKALDPGYTPRSPEHLDAYLDELVFRFNRRTSTARGMLFYRLLQKAVVTGSVTYGDVVRKTPTAVQRKQYSRHPVFLA